jgi:hypothetical protein
VPLTEITPTTNLKKPIRIRMRELSRQMAASQDPDEIATLAAQIKDLKQITKGLNPAGGVDPEKMARRLTKVETVPAEEAAQLMHHLYPGTAAGVQIARQAMPGAAQRAGLTVAQVGSPYADDLLQRQLARAGVPNAGAASMLPGGFGAYFSRKGDDVGELAQKLARGVALTKSEEERLERAQKMGLLD